MSNLLDRRKDVLEEWYTSSDLNGYQVVDGNGWVFDGDTASSVIFVEGESGGPSVRKVLSVQFKLGMAAIDHANLDGDEIIDSYNYYLKHIS